LKFPREDHDKRPALERVNDWREVYVVQEPQERKQEVSTQAARCMDCGVPFCHSGSAGCPLGNLIPEWNDLARRGEWTQASDRLHATNNFPEFTGRICPAPCESACVLAISSASGGAVTIKRVEETIADIASENGFAPKIATVSTGHKVAVVGSGPAGLAAAQQLTRAGHAVTVFERDDRLGGLLRYGIPEFKLEKKVVDRRLAQMRAEGTKFITSCEVGGTGYGALSVEQLRERFDAVVLAVGALAGRDAPDLDGRSLAGVHLAMEHLVPANKICEGDDVHTDINAAGKHVIIIGGGDTGADCYGTAIRQGAASVTQLDQYPMLPTIRDDERSPWPTWPVILRTYPVHLEGGERKFAVAVKRFVGDEHGQVKAIELQEVRVEKDPITGRREVIPVSDEIETLPADLVLFAIGFSGVEDMPLLPGLGIEKTRRGTISCGSDWQTDAPGIFVAGDAHRGASLVVWAIAEGRSVANAVDSYLLGVASDLPSPVVPNLLPLAVV
jgi:glutamate synthase (NADPH/NADH) small chain